MIHRIYILGLAAFYFLLWGFYSNWSFYSMIFWEGNGDLRGPAMRLAAGFLVFVAGLVSVLSQEN